jgi:hypothetical protein
VRVGSSVSDANVTAVAYKNPDNSFAVVMINAGGATVSESVTGAGLPSSWNVYQTTASANCVSLGTSNGAGVSLPANSITSMISGGPIPDIGADTIPYRVAAPVPDMTVGKLNVKGDDNVDVWLNGIQISNVDAGTVKRMVAVHQGNNIIACRVINLAWGGGLLGSMMLPGGDTLHTDGTWKVTYKNPTADPSWVQYAYDDSKWGQAKDIGPANLWPGFAGWGGTAVDMFYQGAHWILGATHTYFRKNITVTTATSGNVYVRGNNFTYRIYIDGSLAKQGSEFGSCTGGCFTAPTSTTPYSFAANSTHCIAYDITDASSDGNGVLMKAGYTHPQGVPMDTTWLCSDTAPTGWNTAAFADTASWSHPDTISAYDAGGGVGKFVYPGHFYFRKQFTSQGGTQALVDLVKLLLHDRVVSVKYFTLQGREFRGDVRRLAASAKTMLIKRTVYRGGRIEDARLLQVTR